MNSDSEVEAPAKKRARKESSSSERVELGVRVSLPDSPASPDPPELSPEEELDEVDINFTFDDPLAEYFVKQEERLQAEKEQLKIAEQTSGAYLDSDWSSDSGSAQTHFDTDVGTVAMRRAGSAPSQVAAPPPGQ